jgi:hypothetical protein
MLGPLAVLLALAALAAADEPSLPPGERPVPVHAGFFLVNLSAVSERNETFEADLYLTFRWHDPRLAFAGTEPRRFLEDAAISFNLPQISYLTVIDRVFLVTYACIALGVLVSTLQAALLRGDRARVARVDRIAGLGLPVPYFALLALCVGR